MEKESYKQKLERIFSEYPETLSPTKVGEMLGVERQTALSYMKTGKLAAYELNPEAEKSHVRALKADVIEYMVHNKIETKQNAEENEGESK